VFTALHAIVRAKRSSKQSGVIGGSFSVRVKYGDEEELIEFENSGVDEIEIRSGDRVRFSLTDSKVRIVENLTIRRIWTTSKPYRDFLRTLTKITASSRRYR